MPVNDPNVVKQLEAPMPWIGAYAGLASTICTLAMATDVFHGLKSRKYWFPSKYFSLNATFLTLLAVAMKLSVDLTTKMYSVTDRLAKVSSLAFMSIAIANFITSLGSMSNKSLFMNVAALAILVITVTCNVCIQIFQMRSYLSSRRAFWEESVAMGLMLLLLLMLVSSAVTILSTKRYLEMRYDETRSAVMRDDEALADVRRAGTEKLKVLIKKHWVMAETSSPKFVIARSVTSTVSGMVSLIIALVLVEAVIRIAIRDGLFDETYSTYGKSTRGILLSQTIGVAVGAIAPTARWFTAVGYRDSTFTSNSLKDVLTVEDHWTLKLVEWRQRSLSTEIRHPLCRKVIHVLKGWILEISIRIQHLIVCSSKIVLAVSICTARPLLSCLNCIRSWRQRQISNSISGFGYQELDIRRCAIQLEGEAELPVTTLMKIFEEVDATIARGRRRKPGNLMNLLSRSRGFKGVKEFDSDEVPPLHDQDIPHCWSLPVVTLACIAVAIPNVGREKSEALLRGVIEGLRYVKFIDKLLDREGRLANVRAAAEAASVEAELRRRWQSRDLNETSVRGRNAREVLELFNQESKETVDDFTTNPKYCLVQNRAYWPRDVIAANAMYRVSKTILLRHGGDDEGDEADTDEEVFERVSGMIADILAACFTNLPRAIAIKCHRCAIEERERGVRKAAKYLGETEEIIALLQQRELPVLEPRRAAYIEEWRVVIGLEEKDNPDKQEDDRIAINIEDYNRV